MTPSKSAAAFKPLAFENDALGAKAEAPTATERKATAVFIVDCSCRWTYANCCRKALARWICAWIQDRETPLPQLGKEFGIYFTIPLGGPEVRLYYLVLQYVDTVQNGRLRTAHPVRPLHFQILEEMQSV